MGFPVTATAPLKTIEEIVRRSRLAQKLSSASGAIAGVVAPDSVEVVSLGTGVDAGTPMEIGSVTKIFTALLLAEAMRRDELKLSDRVDEVLFGLRWTGAPSITAGELATHTSGLPRLSFGKWRALQADPYRGYTRAALLLYLERTQPRSLENRAYFGVNTRSRMAAIILANQSRVPEVGELGVELMQRIRAASTASEGAE